MKKLFCYLVTITIGISSVAMAKEVNLVFAYEDKHNFPYYMDKGSKINWDKPGVSIELLKLLEKNLPVKVDFKRIPWNRCKTALKDGEVDGIFNGSFKKKRMELGQYPMIRDKPDTSKRITTISYVLYALKDSPIKWDKEKKKIHNLKGKIGAPKGYSITLDLQKWGIPIDEAPTTKYDLNRLLRNRVGGVAALELAGDFYLKTDPKYKSVKKLDPPLVTKHYYLMLSHQFVKKHPKLAKKIWAEVEKLRKSELDKILDNYF